MDYPKKEKVLAYIVRNITAQPELLIFKHRDFPEAGWQVPAGTIEMDETIEIALLREVKEESGLTQFMNIQFIDKMTFFHPIRKEWHQRYFYQLSVEATGPDQFEHQVYGGGEDQDLVFQYYWKKLSELPRLAAEQGALLSKIS